MSQFTLVVVVDAITSHIEEELLGEVVVDVVDGVVLVSVVEPNVHIDLPQSQTVAHVDVVPSPQLVGIGFRYIISYIVVLSQFSMSILISLGCSVQGVFSVLLLNSSLQQSGTELSGIFGVGQSEQHVVGFRVDLPLEPTSNSIFSGSIVLILLLDVNHEWSCRLLIILSDFDWGSHSLSCLS